MCLFGCCQLSEPFSMWLFSASFMVDALWWTLTHDIKIFTIPFTSIFTFTCFFLRPPCLWSSSLSPSTHEFMYILILGHFFFHIKKMTWYTTETSAIERFLLYYSLLRIPWVGLEYSCHPLLVEPTYLADSSMTKHRFVFLFFSCHFVIRNPLYSHRYEWREKSLCSSGKWLGGLSYLLK